jgi:hypothetical protein
MVSVAPRERFSAAHFAQTLFDLLDRVEYRRVDPRKADDPVYRLRYEAYRREEFVPFNSQAVVRDEFDELPNAYCFGIYIDGRLVSSLRLHVLTRDFRTSPSYSVFPDVLDPFLDRGETCIDPGRFTNDFEASLQFPALPFLAVRLPVLAADQFDAVHGLASVRPEHGPFYRRVFRSECISEPRYYHGLTFPMQLYACDVAEVREPVMRRYPFFASTAEERQRLFSRTEFATVRPRVRFSESFARQSAAMA